MKFPKHSLSSYIPWLAVFIIAAFLSTYIRLYPLRGHIWSPTHEQATMLVIFNIKKDLLQEIHQQSPYIPLNVATRMAEEQLNQTLHSKSKQVRQAIEKLNEAMVKQTGIKEPVYLLESDPFYFYNLTQNIVDHGRMADTIRGSKYFNPLMTAPAGDWQPLTIHPYIGFIVYKIAQLFSPDIPLMFALGFTPIIIAALTLIPFLWICRMLSIGPWISLAASLIFSLAPIYLKRSAFGWYDTDPYNLGLPLLMLGILIWGFQQLNLRRSITAGILLGITIACHALIWQGWGFMFFVCLASLIAIACWAQFIIKNTALRNQGLCLLLSALATTIAIISLCFGLDSFFILLKEGLGELVKFTGNNLNLWPNLFIGVGELKKSTTKGFEEAIGGWVILSLGFTGLSLLIYRAIKDFKHTQIITHGLILAFLSTTMLVTVGAERFAIFTLIALGLLSAISLNALSMKAQQLAVPHAWARFLPAIALGFIILMLTSKGETDVQTAITPIFNSTWDEALLAIKDKTPPDSIINTWWAPGHFIKAIAQRRVPFDGASLDEGPTGYWISNALLSPDEKHAQGLIRMLNLSGNHAATYLTSCGLKTSEAVSILHTIASKTNSEAALFLKPILNQDQTSHLLTLTHGGHPHSYILLYNELVDENLLLKFTGGWNFAKVEAINDNPQLLSHVPSRNSPGFIDFLWDIAGGQTKYSEALPSFGEQNNFLLFKEKLAIDLQSMDATIDSPQFGTGKPVSIVYLKDGMIKEHMIQDGHLNYSVLLYKQDGQYTARLMDRSLANSLLMKLFYFDGAGLDFFKPLTSAHDLTGRTQIKVFEVVWND